MATRPVPKLLWAILSLLGYGELETALVEGGDESTKVRGEIQRLTASDPADHLWIHGH